MKHDYEITKLSNGSELLVINVPNSQVAGFSIGIRAGSYYPGAEKKELAHLVEHLMFEGNRELSGSEEMSYELEKNGIIHNGHTSGSFMSFEYVFGKEFARNAISLALNQLVSPIFDDAHLEKEKQVIIKELEPDLDSPYYECHFKLLDSITEEAHPVNERIESLSNIKNKDVLDYYKKYFVSENTKFVIFGSFSRAETSALIKVIENGVKNYPKGEKQKIPYPKLKDYKKRVIITESEKAERNCFDLSFINSEYPPDSDRPALRLFYAIYNEGTYSRMFRGIRKKGIGYSFASDYKIGRNFSELFLTNTSFGESALKVFDLGIKELRGLLDGNFSDDELKRARGYVLGAYERKYNTPNDFAGWYIPEFADDEEFVDYNDYLKDLKKVTKEDVLRAANNFIKMDSWALSITGPDSKKLNKEFKRILK